MTCVCGHDQRHHASGQGTDDLRRRFDAERQRGQALAEAAEEARKIVSYVSRGASFWDVPSNDFPAGYPDSTARRVNFALTEALDAYKKGATDAR